MKEITLSLRLTLSECDTLKECVADELYRAEVLAGEDSALAATCSSLLEKITAARLGKATCSTCYHCAPWKNGEALCLCHEVAAPTLVTKTACKDYSPNTDEP